ncbi:MAG TPA: LLM class F420-dependent oxidoreductase [Candidatus Binataceae bacterium]|nr:LLM class F420-dependent oxidoreductase [Candidatus Binataceae bacterium]
MDVGYFAIGIGPLTTPEWVKPVAVTAEGLGFSSIWAPEHVVLLEQYASKYPYSAGEFPMPTDTPFADPFTTLAFAAAYTSKIKIATGICLVPEHNPLVLAKTVATLDRMSGGRFILGVGIGWLAEEFQALGLTFDRRAQRTREYIDVMRKLWSESKSSHSGEFVSFPSVQSYPKPHNNRSVPVWFGGESGPALRRVGEYGDGWVGFNLTPDEAAPKIKRIEEVLKANGRKRSDVYLSVSPYGKKITTDDLKRYRDAGADEVVLVVFDIPSTVTDLTARMEQMAKDFVEPAAKL